jgi:exopolysaccharide biosynthesis polyprenyl glycosylphosphotransferase
MLKDHPRLIFALLISFDIFLSLLVFVFLLSATGISGVERPWEEMGQSVFSLSFAAILVWPAIFQHMEFYSSARTTEVSSILSRLAMAAVVASTLLAAVAFATSAPVKPSFPFVCAAAQFGVLACSRIFIFLPLRTARRYGRNFRNVIIVGTGPRAAYVRQMIEAQPEWGFRVIGFVDDRDTALDASLFNVKLFKLEAMPDILREQIVDRVIIAAPRSMFSSLSPIVSACSSAGIPFTMLADIFGDFLPPPKATHFGTLAALDFAPVHHSPGMLAVKRWVDVVGASIALIAVMPLLALAALAIRFDDGQPIFFRQTRCGLNGRTFTMFKLRTMCMDAEERRATLAALNECDGPIFKVRKDPRITRVGAILRKLSIDELPQLWNVLRGDMSLVGPRPPLPQEVIEYQTYERRRHSMRPGNTCIWLVSGRSNIGFERWVQLDVKYIDSWSLGLDIWILLKTIPAVLRGEGAS